MFFFRNRKENVVEKLVPEIFLKNQNQRYLWISSLKFYKACFFLYVQVEDYQNMLKLRADHLLSPHTKLFKKQRGVELVYLSHFLYDF